MRELRKVRMLRILGGLLGVLWGVWLLYLWAGYRSIEFYLYGIALVGGTLYTVAFGARWRALDSYRWLAIETPAVAACFTVIAIILKINAPPFGPRESNVRLSHVKILAGAFLIYAEDNDGCLPTAHWAVPVKKHLKDWDASAFPTKGIWPAYNKHLVSLPMSSIEDPVKVVMVFESALPYGSTGTILDAALPQPGKVAATGFADSHVKLLDRDEMVGAVWIPVIAKTKGKR